MLLCLLLPLLSWQLVLLAGIVTFIVCVRVVVAVGLVVAVAVAAAVAAVAVGGWRCCIIDSC